MFEICHTKTTGPEVPMFGRFKQAWPRIDLKSFKSGISDEKVNAELSDVKSDILKFATSKLEVKI